MSRLREKLNSFKEDAVGDVLAGLKKDLQGEKDAIKQYKERITACAALPKLAMYISIEQKLKEILKDEEDHLKILEDILDKHEALMDF